MAFYSAESEKCHFHFPFKSITCDASHRFGRPSMGALMTSCEVINFGRERKFEYNKIVLPTAMIVGSSSRFQVPGLYFQDLEVRSQNSEVRFTISGKSPVICRWYIENWKLDIRYWIRTLDHEKSEKSLNAEGRWPPIRADRREPQRKTLGWVS